MISEPTRFQVTLPTLHPKQIPILASRAKRKIIRAGRRFGKTWLAADLAVEEFLDGKRVLYAAPTTEQLERFWFLVKDFLGPIVKAKVFYKNESQHVIEREGTTNRIRAKTAWNADTLRGDFADVLILDEWQLMDEDAWELVGAPMLLDNNGDAMFIYTPPSLKSRSISKARDPQHAAKMYKRAEQRMKEDQKAKRTSRWEVFTGSSLDNPTISKQALAEIAQDMTSLAYRQEILAEDVDEVPGALWNRDMIERNRELKSPATEDFDMIVVGVDPSATSTGDEAGIVVCAKLGDQIYILDDASIQGSPELWARSVCTMFHKYQANYVIAEQNQGGEMVTSVIKQVDRSVPVVLVHASRGKYTRAEPVAVVYEKNKVHHVGYYPVLEDEMCLWLPGGPSPNRMDALVWGVTYLIGGVMPQVY